MTEYSNADGTTIDVPDDLIAAMGPGWSKVGGGSKPKPTPKKPDPEQEPATVDKSTDGEVDGTPPPRSGKGSSDANWTAYARSQGVEVTEEMTRKEVIVACEDAGVPVS